MMIETLDGAIKKLRSLGCFAKHEWINECWHAPDGSIQKFKKYVSSNPDLELVLVYGTGDPEDEAPDLPKTIKLSPAMVERASAIVLKKGPMFDREYLISYKNVVI